MENFGPFHWLVVLAISLLLISGTEISELFRRIGGGPDDPNHPLAVTSPVETNSGERQEKKKSDWQTSKSVLRFLLRP